MKYLSFLTLLILLPALAHAATTTDTSFVPLTNIPALFDTGNQFNLQNFLNGLYRVCIGAAAVIAVLQIMRAGIMYMGGDSVTEKKEARSLIGLAIGGLILVLSPVIVFSIINPEILSLKIGNIDKLNVPLDMSSSTPVTTPEEDQIMCNLTYVEKQSVVLTQGQTCTSVKGADWENISTSCCIAASGSTCCGRKPQTPGAPAYGTGTYTYKIAVKSSDFTKLGNPACVYYKTGSSPDVTQCGTASIAAEQEAKSAEEYKVVKSCSEVQEKSLQGTSMYQLPTCSQ